jgi:hypothetical protein
MQNKITATFNKVHFSPDLDNEAMSQILSHIPYNDEKGLGFTKVDNIDDVLELILLKRVPTSIRTYNYITETFEQNDIFIFEEINFYIDLKNNLLYTFGSASKLNKAKNDLREFVENQIIYENIGLTISKILNQIEVEKWQYDIKDITIKNFVFEEGASGKFVANVNDQITGRKLIDKYIDSISKITLDVMHEDFGDFELTIGTNNSISIRCREDETFIIIDAIKKLVK